MTLAQALQFMQPAKTPQTRLGLDRITQLTHLLGNPQDSLRFIHVAGSNGKGSVCAMLASVLQAAGYTTGLYTSPHLFRINERIKVNGAEITNKELVELAQETKHAVDQMESNPSEFERITAMALLYFKKRGCDVVVLEVGLGGRLDATNVIGAPDAAVITNIGLEHTEYLGNTLAQVAAEKGGIIKKGMPVILYEQSEEVRSVIQRICREMQAPLYVTDREKTKICFHSLKGQCISYRNRTDLQLPLLGAHQVQNAAVVLDCVDVLNREQGYHISDRAVYNGFSTVEWPGRFEVLAERPLVIVDGAHNPNGVEQLARCVQEYLPGREITLVMGVMADKDYKHMICMMAPYAKRFIAVAPDCHRALDAQSLAGFIEAETGLPAVCGGTVKDGLKAAVRNSKPEDVVIIFGSLYQVGEVREYFGREH